MRAPIHRLTGRRRSSDAVLAHVGNLGELLGQLLEVSGGCELEVFGNPSAELREVTTGLDVAVFPYFQGK